MGFLLPDLPKIQIWSCHFLASNPAVAPNALRIKSKRLCVTQPLLLSQASPDAMLSSPLCQTTEIPLTPTILSRFGDSCYSITLISFLLPANSYSSVSSQLKHHLPQWGSSYLPDWMSYTVRAHVPAQPVPLYITYHLWNQLIIVFSDYHLHYTRSFVRSKLSLSHLPSFPQEYSTQRQTQYALADWLIFWTCGSYWSTESKKQTK